jgi:hypothetical protein
VILGMGGEGGEEPVEVAGGLGSHVGEEVLEE